MDYLKYVMLVGLASLSVAAVCCLALWLMAPLLLARARPAEQEPEAKAPPPSGPEKAGGGVPGVAFDFTPEQAPALAGLLEKEAPGDIAVVVSRMPAAAGRALLAALAPELRPEVMLSLAAPRAVGLGLMRAMKTELEDRLYGVVGGPAEAAAFIRALPYGERKGLLEKISSRDPGRFAELRALFVLDEDLLSLPPDDLQKLAAAVPAEKLGNFLPALPEELAVKLKEQFSGKAALALTKAAAQAVPGAKGKEAALGELVELVEKLAAKGVIAKPQPRAKTQAAPAAAAAKDDWG